MDKLIAWKQASTATVMQLELELHQLLDGLVAYRRRAAKEATRILTQANAVSDMLSDTHASAWEDYEGEGEYVAPATEARAIDALGELTGCDPDDQITAAIGALKEYRVELRALAGEIGAIQSLPQK